MTDYKKIKHSKKASELFRQGYNCSQSVFGAFAGDFGLNLDFALMISSGFGGGMGRLRETCGAVTGGIMVLSLVYGYNKSEDYDKKKQLYEAVQNFVKDFKEELGTSLCRELLGTDDSSPTPTERTNNFYKERPCEKFISAGARILEKYI